MSVQGVISDFGRVSALAEGDLRWHSLPPSDARYGTWPAGLDERIVAAFARRGAPLPYSHQAQAVEHALAGRDQVIVTPTASGKTLCYTAPVLQAIADDYLKQRHVEVARCEAIIREKAAGLLARPAAADTSPAEQPSAGAA